MLEFDALRAITRRALPIEYISPMICANPAEFSASGSGAGDLSSLEILPTFQKAGTTLAITQPSVSENRLEWILLDYAFAYVVYRSMSLEGPFEILVSGVVENFWVDAPDLPGTYFYKTTGIEADFGETVASNIVSGTV